MGEFLKRFRKSSILCHVCIIVVQLCACATLNLFMCYMCDTVVSLLFSLWVVVVYLLCNVSLLFETVLKLVCNLLVTFRDLFVIVLWCVVIVLKLFETLLKCV